MPTDETGRAASTHATSTSAGTPQWPGPTDPHHGPINWLWEEHAQQLALAEALEHIADSLPDEVDTAFVAAALAFLKVSYRNHVRFEEEAVFPLLRLRAPGAGTVSDVLAQLEHEHDVDECYADDLADELSELVQSGRARNPDMLGYMLRGFFVSLRRHVDWENTVVLPLAREVLTKADCGQLVDWLDAHKQPEAGRMSAELFRLMEEAGCRHLRDDE